ncbi:MAG: P-loop NTPase [Candidatus Muirbacterium halophilum]|nr:P-loop NTPase [Candidatus Muirbacterium halophilum]MCK9476168.1 P-loop NTPase [Candidatus Muirbacterium halophilum]
MNDNYIKNLIAETQQLVEKDNIIVKPENKIKKIISIASGKGGVGKTTLAVNFSLALSALNIKTTLLDVDLGLGDGDIIMGLSLKNTLIDFLTKKVDFKSIVNRYFDIDFISAGSGISELADLGDTEKNFIWNSIKSNLHTDVLFVDTGAGISSNTTFFLKRSDFTIIIATPEPTSFVDAYGAIKTMFARGYNNILVLINRAYDEEEALDIFSRMNRVSEKSLGKSLTYLGFIPEDKEYQYALFKRKPVFFDKDSQARFYIEKVIGLLYNDFIK